MTDVDTTDTATDQSASATDTDQADTSTTDTEVDKDWQAEAEKWKSTSRKNEDRAKANAAAAKELEELKKSQMSDIEKAVAEAKSEGRTEALREAGAVMVEAEIKAAAAGRKIDVSALIEGVDKTRFLTDEGKPDTDAIAAWVNKVAPPEPTNPKIPEMGQGALGSQITPEDTLRTQARAAMGLPPK